MRIARVLALFLSAVAVIVVAGETRALACSCREERPPCEVFWQAAAVFDGVVLSVVLLDDKGRETTGRHGEGAPHYVHVRFAIRAAYRGVGDGEVDVFTGLGGGDCGYGFEKGKRYLVYAYRPENSEDLQTGICSRTRPLEEAGDDLAYIKTIPAARGGRIYGTISEYGYSGRSRWEEPAVRGPVVGAVVTAAAGERRVSATTDARGGYEITGLATGKYALTVTLPRNLALLERKISSDPSIEVEVNAAGCSEVDLPAGRVALKGTVLDERGSPTEENVYLVSVSNPEFQLSLISGKDGRFAFVGAPPGRYALATGLDSVPTVGLPHPQSFHPGVEEIERATAFVVTATGEPIEVVHRLPEPVPQVTLAGSAVWPDGTPAQGVEINVVEQTSYGRSTADHQTGADGSFSFPALADGEYTVYAEYRFGGDGLIRSASVVVRASVDATPIRLVVGPEAKAAAPETH